MTGKDEIGRGGRPGPRLARSQGSNCSFHSLVMACKASSIFHGYPCPAFRLTLVGLSALYQLHFNTGLSDATSRFYGEVSKEGAAFPPIAHRLDASPSSLDEVTRLATSTIVKKQRT